MKANWNQTIGCLLLFVAWIATGWAQPSQPFPQPGSSLKVQGEVSSVELAPPSGSPTLMLTASDGKMYMIHLGPLTKLRTQGFSPKVGDKIEVTGEVCCQAHGHVMIHSSEITLGGKTYQTPEAAMPADCCCVPRAGAGAARR